MIVDEPEYSYREYSAISLLRKEDNYRKPSVCEIRYTNYINCLLLPLLSVMPTYSLDETRAMGCLGRGVFMPITIKQDSVRLLKSCCEHWVSVLSVYQEPEICVNYSDDQFISVPRERLLTDLQKISDICTTYLLSPEEYYFYFDYNLLDVARYFEDLSEDES